MAANQLPVPPLRLMRTAADKLRAMTHECRYGEYLQEQTYINYDGERWILLTAMRASKPRFQDHSLEELKDAMLQELDHRGRHRFQIHRDSEGQTWVSAQFRR